MREVVLAGRLSRVSGVEVIRALRRDGWQQGRQMGSHVHLRHPDRPGLVTVPIHRGETLAPKLVSSILDQAGMSADQLRELLQGEAMRRYTLFLTPDAEAGMYMVSVPSLPGCFTEGCRVEEALSR